MSVLADYAAEFLEELRSAETFEGVQSFVAERLKRLGAKHKMLGDDITVDLGRGERLAFVSDGSIEQTAALLAAVRYVGTKPPIPLRFAFGGGDTDNGVFEAYAFMPCNLDARKIGFCYGTASVGRAQMTLDFEPAVLGAAETAERAIAVDGVELEINKVGTSLEIKLRYFDGVMCERAALAIERAALDADDMYGTTHMLIVKSVCPPVTNYALAVDKVRYIAGIRAVNIPPCRECYPLSESLSRSHGCLVFVGADEDRGDTAAATAELIGEIINIHVV